MSSGGLRLNSGWPSQCTEAKGHGSFAGSALQGAVGWKRGWLRDLVEHTRPLVCQLGGSLLPVADVISCVLLAEKLKFIHRALSKGSGSSGSFRPAAPH